MDFASSSWAAEDRSRGKGIVVKSSVVPQQPSKVMGCSIQVGVPLYSFVI